MARLAKVFESKQRQVNNRVGDEGAMLLGCC
jgi:hypothetical protein